MPIVDKKLKKSIEQLKDQLQKAKTQIVQLKNKHIKFKNQTLDQIKIIKEKIVGICNSNFKLSQQNKKLKKDIEMMEFIIQQNKQFRMKLDDNKDKIQQKQIQIQDLQQQLEVNSKYIQSVIQEDEKKSIIITELQILLSQKQQELQKALSNINNQEDLFNPYIKSQSKQYLKSSLPVKLEYPNQKYSIIHCQNHNNQSSKKSQRQKSSLFLSKSRSNQVQQKKRQSIISEPESFPNCFKANKNRIPRLSYSNYNAPTKAIEQQTQKIGNRLNKLLRNMSQQLTNIKKNSDDI